MPIPVNIEKLISGRIVENERIEYKKGWNPAAIYRTICAFANDFENIGGGYIIVGAEEEKGRAKRPVNGVSIEKLDGIQKEMIGFNNLIRPFYAPKLSIETVDNVSIIVIWAPGGNDRPYEVPDDVTAKEKKHNLYIRRYASSVHPSDEERKELFELASKIPFDDRINREATIDDISPLLVREYLSNIKSALLAQIETAPLKDIYRAMDLLSGPDEYVFPKNIALLMFNHHPEKFFPYSRIEIVEFPNGLGDPTFFEKPSITGPLYSQVQQALQQLRSLVLKERIYKLPDRAEAERIWNYPYRAVEEAMVNAVYHKTYQVREPIEIRILPDCIEIINQGGPDRSSKLNDIKRGIIRNKRYRNRRIGDFFKELDMTEGRGTGIPIILSEMKKNGSPDPVFETGDTYDYFITTLPIHPVFLSDEGINEGVNDDIAVSRQEVGRKSAGSRREVGRKSAGSRQEVGGKSVSRQEVEFILNSCMETKSAMELTKEMGLVDRDKFKIKYINPLLNENLLAMTVPGKPTSRLQRYYTTEKGKTLLYNDDKK